MIIIMGVLPGVGISLAMMKARGVSEVLSETLVIWDSLSSHMFLTSHYSVNKKTMQHAFPFNAFQMLALFNTQQLCPCV